MAKKNTHYCSECIEEFAAKDIYVATKPGQEYSTYYCSNCMKEIGITEFRPYLKPRKTKTKIK